MKSRRYLWPAAAVLVALLLGACTGSPKEPLQYDAASWPATMERIALVELSYDRRYQPPPDIDLSNELRRALKKELESKGYQLLIADGGDKIYSGETSATELAELAPAESDAALAVHIDLLFLSATFFERNPPPQAEIAGEARLIDKQNGSELWKGRGDGVAGGAGDGPLFYPTARRLEALADFASGLFHTLPDRR